MKTFSSDIKMEFGLEKCAKATLKRRRLTSIFFIRIRVDGALNRSEERFQKYRKIPKISPWAYIFQRPFLRGLFLEGLIFGGAYLRREICVSKSIG